MRPLHLLYKLVRAEYTYQCTQKKVFSDGICNVISALHLGHRMDIDEYEKIKSHLKSQKPSGYQHLEFTVKPCYVGNLNIHDLSYWWDNNKRGESNGERLRFLDKMVEITEKAYDLEQEARRHFEALPERDIRMTYQEMFKIVKDTFMNRMETEPELQKESEGICLSVMWMFTVDIINEIEQHNLFHFINQNKPSKHVNPEFFNASNYIGGEYWWNNKMRDASNASRIAFLDKMIKIAKLFDDED